MKSWSGIASFESQKMPKSIWVGPRTNMRSSILVDLSSTSLSSSLPLGYEIFVDESEVNAGFLFLFLEILMQPIPCIITWCPRLVRWHGVQLEVRQSLCRSLKYHLEGLEGIHEESLISIEFTQGSHLSHTEPSKTWSMGLGGKMLIKGAKKEWKRKAGA